MAEETARVKRVLLDLDIDIQGTQLFSFFVGRHVLMLRI